MDSIFLNGDISRLPSLSSRTSSIIVGTESFKNDILFRTNNQNAIYINDTQNLLINTSRTRGRINIGNTNDHMVLYYGNDNAKYSTISVDIAGALRLSSVNSIFLDSNVYLMGGLIRSTASEINYLNEVTLGIVTANKAIIANQFNDISGFRNLTTETIAGTLTTSAQPNITSIGTLSTLAVSGGLSASTIAGTLTTSDQSNITKIGTLQSLTVSDSIFATTLFGTLSTSDQSNITKIGTLESLSVTNGITATLVSASSFMGTLLTSAQPNITSVGTLASLQVSDGITSNSLTIGQNTLGSSEIGYLTQITPGTATESKALILNQSKNISGINNLTAATLTGTLQTATQPNITSVGTLGSLNVLTDITASTLTGTIQTSSQPNITSVGALTNLTVTNQVQATQVTATNLSGTVQTASQPNITSVGKLNSLNVAGAIVSDTTIYAKGGYISDVAFSTGVGGTGFTTYSKGDLLVGDSTQSLSKVSVPVSVGSLLSYTNNSATGVSWGFEYLAQNFTLLKTVQTNSNTSYSIGPYFGMDTTNQYPLQIPSTLVNLTTIGANGLAKSAALSGTIFPAVGATTLTGTGTTFVTDIVANHTVIQLGSEFRKVVSVVNNTSIQISASFTLLNSWALGATGTFGTPQRFGTNAFSGGNAVTSNTTLTIGSRNSNYTSSSSKLWTLDFWVRLNSTAAAQSIASSVAANTFAINSAAITGAVSISLGQGTTFNITNASNFGNLAANTYAHIAVVFTGTSYVVYLNGTAGLTVNSSLSVTASCFNSFRFGSNGATNFNGLIDEVRISSIARYTGNFTSPNTAFTFDSNTIALNHFDNTSSITASDETTLSTTPGNQYNYNIDGGIAASTVYYCYAITDTSLATKGFVVSSSSSIPPFPTGYTIYKKIPFYVVSNASSLVVPSHYSGDSSSAGTFINFLNPINIVTLATNTTALNTSLFPYVPVNTTRIEILVTHAHLTNTSCGVVVGHNGLGYTVTLLTTNTPSTIQTQYTLPITQMSIDSFFNIAAAGSTYTIAITGFYVRT